MSAVHFHSVSCLVDETNFYFSYNSYKIHHVYGVIVLHAYIHAQPHLVAGINCDSLSKNWTQLTKSTQNHAHHMYTQGQNWVHAF